MRPFPAGGAMLLLASMTAGCAHRDAVILFPNEGGAATGAVAVLDPQSGQDIGVLDRANSRGSLTPGRVGVTDRSPASLEKRYGELLASLPEPPKPFTLYFVENETELVPASLAMLEDIFAEIRRRPGADVQIVGHTDTLGKQADNDALSRRRAQATAEMLTASRFQLDFKIVTTVGRGERDLIVQTPDETRTWQNRRVEVIVR